MTTLELIEKHGIGHNCLSDAYELGRQDATRWIPVTERLPEDFEEYKGKKVIDVLVTTANGKVTKVQRKYDKWIGWYFARIYNSDNTKAWMPMPEPYKEEGEK